MVYGPNGRMPVMRYVWRRRLSAAALASFFSFFARSVPRSVPLSSARASGSPEAAGWTGGVRSPDAALASPASGRGTGVLRLRELDTMARSS